MDSVILPVVRLSRADLSELRTRESCRLTVLQGGGGRTGPSRARGPRVPQGRHGALLRRRRLDGARRVDRPRGTAHAPGPLLRRGEGDRRAPRRERRAAEMRAALPELGVQARIGVNTGEVVVGTEERLATGDAVNVAARLEQSAGAGEVILGPETARL